MPPNIKDVSKLGLFVCLFIVVIVYFLSVAIYLSEVLGFLNLIQVVLKGKEAILETL